MKPVLHAFHCIVNLFNPSIKDAELLLKSYRNYILRFCQQREGYGCIAFMGVFKSTANDLIVQIDRNGKKVSIPPNKEKTAANPELHIIFLSCPSRMIATETERYFNRRNGKVHSFIIDNDIGYALSYAMKYSSTHRTIVFNTDLLPDKNLAEFINVAECMNVTQGGKVPIFEDLSIYRFNEIRKILESNGLEIASNTECSYKEQMMRQGQLSSLFNIRFTSGDSSLV